VLSVEAFGALVLAMTTPSSVVIDLEDGDA
jgi:hypothetical protein